MTIDEYIEQRNLIFLQAESISKELGDKCRECLGVANRHIERVLNNQFHLNQVENEIQKCFERTKRELNL